MWSFFNSLNHLYNGCRGWGGPHDAGNYNCTPEQTGFFMSHGGSWDTAYGSFFLSWYSQSLLQHAKKILKATMKALDRHGIPRRFKASQQVIHFPIPPGLICLPPCFRWWEVNCMHCTPLMYILSIVKSGTMTPAAHVCYWHWHHGLIKIVEEIFFLLKQSWIVVEITRDSSNGLSSTFAEHQTQGCQSKIYVAK